MAADAAPPLPNLEALMRVCAGQRWDATSHLCVCAPCCRRRAAKCRCNPVLQAWTAEEQAHLARSALPDPRQVCLHALHARA